MFDCIKFDEHANASTWKEGVTVHQAYWEHDSCSYLNGKVSSYVDKEFYACHTMYIS